ncbi:DUF7167 family protein [Paenibacillus macquariensis]|uniref:DUF7167 domain-containing protein n=1 Tax=Paenibacillus macquariensis TaxID=948756 RepID=A0ABY1JXB9_9BACL|nr:hypothetical protein [Paenibacillus macquariensis]MEC0089356.1 hypothetical protein [Paenibacillus macquariensis]SIQ93123.1 hypothetical protein SAMN05421578_105102 [Paenibacillus macquariensis]
MIVNWKMSIGYLGACREGEVEIQDEDFEGLSEEERTVLIYKEIHEDAMQYVDINPTNL